MGLGRFLIPYSLGSPGPATLDYLVIGGGGGGGSNVGLADGKAGGGGAGGGGAVLRSFNTSSGDITTPINAEAAGVFTIVVGAGGASANGGASSIAATGVSISANGGYRGNNSSSTTGGAGGSSGNSNSGSPYGDDGAFLRGVCGGTAPNHFLNGTFAPVNGGNFGGAGGGAGGSASGTTRGTGLSSLITGSNINYGQGGKSYLGTAMSSPFGGGGQGGGGDNEIAMNEYNSPTLCTQINYGSIFYQAPTNGQRGAVYLRWTGGAPSDYTGGTLSTVGGDNLLSYTTAGTYTLTF